MKAPKSQNTKLETLAGNPWFRRVWIIQEIATARAATILCGHWRMSSAVFALIPAVFGFSVPDHCQSVLDIMPGHSRGESWWREQPDLHTLLSKFGGCEASDVRDKVFALMGIAVDGRISECFHPDYEKTPDQVAQDTTSFILFHEVLDLSDHGFPNFTLDELLEKVEHVFEQVFDWALRESRKEIILRLLGAKTEATQEYIRKKAVLCHFARRHPSGPLQSKMSSDQRKPREPIDPRLLREERDRDDSLFEWALGDVMVDVNVRDQSGETPLHKAIAGGQITRLELLLRRKDILLDKPNRRGLFPLSQAVTLRRKEIVGILLAYEVDVNHMGGGLTPIAISIRQKSAAITKMLLARHDLDLNHGEFRPLLESVQDDQESIIRYPLRSSHLDVYKYMDGNAALMQAIKTAAEGY